jgi:uncharacterized protein
MNRDLLLRILAEWLEEKALPALTARDVPHFSFGHSSDILAIVGPRRAGKTYFMYQLIQELLASGKGHRDEILFIDFEDYRLMDFRASDVDSLLAAFVELTGKKPRYLFLDEIQHLHGWSRVLRTLHNRGAYKIVVSGSNSQLLTREVATELRGRYRDLLMLPFSFKEWLRQKGIQPTRASLHTSSRGHLLHSFDTYLREGGFPEVVRAQTGPEKRQILQTYYRTIYYKDILERYQIKAKSVLEQLMSYSLNTYSELFSVSGFEKYLKSSGPSGSKRTIANYLRYLDEAFFVITHEKYAASPKQRMMNPKKLYLFDTGFVALSTDFSENRGKILENLVAIELFRRQQNVFYFKGQRECDFVVKGPRGSATALQVCWEIGPRNEERETKGLLEAMSVYGVRHGLILTHDQEGRLKAGGTQIELRPVWKWCLAST